MQKNKRESERELSYIIAAVKSVNESKLESF